jgi:hypothetical protein
MTSHPDLPRNKLDLQTIFAVPLRQFVPWLVIVLIVVAAGYPGVVCVTPMAWLLALRVGNLCASRSKSSQSSRRLIEAALAGGFLGFLQGMLFLVVIPFMGPYQSAEIARVVTLTLVMLFIGIMAGAGLSFFTAYMTEQRHNRL